MCRPSQVSSSRDHIFYTGMALIFACSVFVGFSRTYYLKLIFGTPHLSGIAHLHGAVFTAWTLFFVFQTGLIFAGRTDIHRRVGTAGAVFGIGIVLLGAAMTIHSVRAGYASGRPDMAELSINAIIDLLLFCGFFATGWILRYKKEIHKRCMMLAMMSLIIPSIARLPIPFGMIAWVICAFSLTGVAYDLIVLRRVHLTSIVGALLINVATPLRFIIADTQAWQNVAEWIMKS